MTALDRPIPQVVLQSDPALDGLVMKAHRDGLEATARIQAAAYATSVALQNANVLARTVDAAFKSGPCGADMFVGIVAAYEEVAVAEIKALAPKGRRS